MLEGKGEFKKKRKRKKRKLRLKLRYIINRMAQLEWSHPPHPSFIVGHSIKKYTIQIYSQRESKDRKREKESVARTQKTLSGYRATRTLQVGNPSGRDRSASSHSHLALLRWTHGIRPPSRRSLHSKSEAPAAAAPHCIARL